MLNDGKRSILGVMISVIDYEGAVQAILDGARQHKPLAVSALAVHAVMTGVADPEFRFQLNHLDLATPDGQPVRWALNMLYGTGLRDRVYGPNLLLRVCAGAEKQQASLYFYGSTPEVLAKLEHNLHQQFPQLRIVGTEPSKFRRLSPAERDELINRIEDSGAQITVVGLGCPRQEIWAYEFRERLHMPILAVGAAFDFHAGTKPQAPHWMQNTGLEWFYRFVSEPRRLWRRYLLLNPAYIVNIAAQKLRLRTFDSSGSQPAAEQLYG